MTASHNIRVFLQEGYRERDGVYYFTDVPVDVIPSDESRARRWGYWRKQNFTFFEKSLASFSDGTILVDVGTGQAHFRSLWGKFCTVTLDFYPYPKVNVVADLNRALPLRDNIADVVTLSNVLEHVRHPEILLTECYRTLRHGGMVMGTVPFFFGVHQRPYDYFRYTDIGLTALLRDAGYVDVKVEPVVELSILAYDLVRALFHELIIRTHFSNKKFLQHLHIFILRFVWKIVRTCFALLRPIFVKAHPDRDLPLGYLFTAEKPLE